LEISLPIVIIFARKLVWGILSSPDSYL